MFFVGDTMGVRNEVCKILSCNDNVYNWRANFFSSWWSLIWEVAGFRSSSQALKKSLKTWKLKLSEMVEGRSGQVRNVPADFRKGLRTKIDRYMSATELPVAVKIRVCGDNCSFLWKLEFRDKMTANVPKCWDFIALQKKLLLDGGLDSYTAN